MSLANHLEQISSSATAIRDLSFPKPKSFTNALLDCYDITSLIRDTEAHERALFTYTPTGQKIFDPTLSATHENATYGPGTRSYASSLRNTTARAMLGGEILEKIRKGNTTQEKTDVDVELLLRGAENLCAVYPIEGAIDKIRALRRRYERLSSSVSRYEDRVAKQGLQLDMMNHSTKHDGETKRNKHISNLERIAEAHRARTTVEDVKREEDEIKSLERKKQLLEDRVNGMEQDLGAC